MEGCYRCGSEQGNVARLCPGCNEQRMKEQEAVIREMDPRSGTKGPKKKPQDVGEPANFGLRFFAAVVDYGILQFLLGLATLGPAVYLRVANGGEIGKTIVTAVLIQVVFSFVIVFCYRPLCESSPMRATPGKLLFKLQVIDLRGDRIGILRAFAREAARLLYVIPALVIGLVSALTSTTPSLSALILGSLLTLVISIAQYGIVLVRPDRRALHDLVTGTRVLVGVVLPLGEFVARAIGALLLYGFFTVLSLALTGQLS